MKQITIIISILLLTLCAPAATSAQTVPGQKTLGLRTGYVSKNQSATAGVEFNYTLTTHARLGLNADYLIRHHNHDGLTLALNYSCPLRLTPAHPLYAYPIAGLCYSTWTHHPTHTDDVSTRRSRAGIDLGAGIEIHPTPTMRIALEARYDFPRHQDTALITAGISYIF